MLWGNDSMLFSIVAPVVVNPDIVSKKASVTDGIFPLNQNGSIPKEVNRIQVKETMQ